jgi:hypothetical protein
VHDVGKETKFDLIKQDKAGITLITILDHYYMSSGFWNTNHLVECVFADRATKGDGDDVVLEYLVKWQGLPCAEPSW